MTTLLNETLLAEEKEETSLSYSLILDALLADQKVHFMAEPGPGYNELDDEEMDDDNQDDEEIEEFDMDEEEISYADQDEAQDAIEAEEEMTDEDQDDDEDWEE